LSRKLPLFVLVGPTGVGKTAISIAVAKQIGGEIISGDSMQIYRGMDIGTAKITPAEMAGVPHHLIDLKQPDEPFSVAEFQERVDRLIREISARGHIPMLIGGTGLYVRSILEAYTFTGPDVDQALRDELEAAEGAHGPGHLHAKLTLVDPAAARRLHPNDLRRIIRALEVYLTTGVPISTTQIADPANRRYADLFVGLTMDRSVLYQRIEQRVDQMLQAGWLDEARHLLATYDPHLPTMTSLGYRELVLYLRGSLTDAEAVDLIKRNTRRYAKRQMTWFRRDHQIRWLTVTHPAERTAAIGQILAMIAGQFRITEE
jgi:tRNA dimethylallyltransferase